MNRTELSEILKNHQEWLNGGSCEKRADLSRADLSRANLSRANLSGADLSRANLSGADLSRANLSGANLSGADLSGADLYRADLSWANLSDTIYDGINWLLLLGIVPINGKCRAYKMVNSKGEGTYLGGLNYVKRKKFEVPEVDRDLNLQCSYGINLATLAWCLSEKQKGYSLLLMEFNFKDAVCPIGSDGKFRVTACTKIGKCDWKGNLLQEK